MPMKSGWLFIAVISVIFLWIPEKLKGLWMLFGCIYLWKLNKKSCFICLICMVLFLFQYKPFVYNPIENEVMFQVVSIHNKYAIGLYKNQKFMIDNLDKIGIDDKVKATLTCEVIRSQDNFYGLQFAEHMKKKGINQRCKANDVTLIKKGNSIKAKIHQKILQLPSSLQSFLLLLLMQIYSGEVKLFYMIYASGMHLKFLIQGIYKYLKMFVSSNKIHLLIAFFCLLIGYTTSFYPSIICLFFHHIVIFLTPNKNAFDRLGLTILGIVLLDYKIVYELAFVLPFTIRFFALFKKRDQNQYLFVIWILIPIQLFYFQKLDILQLLCFPILKKGYGYMYIYAWLCYLFPNFFIENIPIFVYHILHTLQQFSYTIYYQANVFFLIIWFLIFIFWINYQKNFYQFLFLLLCVYTQICAYLRPYLEIHMINVGQGDSILISLPFQKGNILIDVAGHKKKDNAKEIIVPLLKSKGIHHIDKMVITHNDFDHNGALLQLQKNMKVKEIVTQKNQSFEIGSIAFQILLPNQKFENENENSIILYFEMYGMSFLFMGDAGIPVENQLLKQYPNLKVDVLKVGHHGSNSSSSSAFVHQIQPQIALISCGIKNFYGHPHKEVLQTFQREKVKVLTTAHHGGISIKVSNLFRFYHTAHQEFGIIKNR